MAKQQPSFLILQFDPLKQSTTKLSCNLTYTPIILTYRCNCRRNMSADLLFHLFLKVWDLFNASR